MEKYSAEYRLGGREEKVTEHDLRRIFYKNGVTYTFEKKNRKGEVIERIPVHFKMLMRSTGKAKQGECIFIRDSLHHKAINFLTMGFYDLMDEQSKNDQEKVFKLVELSAYQTLTTAMAKGYIRIPLESIINKKGFTFDEKKAGEQNLKLITEKTKDALKENGFRMNGKYPGKHKSVGYTKKECVADYVTNAQIKNILWDGMGLIDEKIFPQNMNKFVDMMGGTDRKAYKFYRNYMKRFDDYFSIVKTACPSHWGDLQLMAYQMNNSLPTIDREVLERITECGVNFCNELKTSDTAYLKYLDKKRNDFNINELLIELVKWNQDFLKTEFFQNKKSSDMSEFIKDCKEGRVPQIADNLTIMDNL